MTSSPRQLLSPDSFRIDVPGAGKATFAGPQFIGVIIAKPEPGRLYLARWTPLENLLISSVSFGVSVANAADVGVEVSLFSSDLATRHFLAGPTLGKLTATGRKTLDVTDFEAVCAEPYYAGFLIPDPAAVVDAAARMWSWNFGINVGGVTDLAQAGEGSTNTAPTALILHQTGLSATPAVPVPSGASSTSPLICVRNY